MLPGKNMNLISSSFLPIKSDTAFGISENNNVNIFCKYFSVVLNLLKNETMPINDFAWVSPVEIKSKTGIECNFEYVPQIFVEKDMRSLNDLNAGILKDVPSEIAPPFLFRINLSIQTDIVQYINHQSTIL